MGAKKLRRVTIMSCRFKALDMWYFVMPSAVPSPLYDTRDAAVRAAEQSGFIVRN